MNHSTFNIVLLPKILGATYIKREDAVFGDATRTVQSTSVDTVTVMELPLKNPDVYWMNKA